MRLASLWAQFLGFLMYSNSSPRRITSYSVEYPTLPSLADNLPKPDAITIVQKQYSHDVAMLHFPLLNEMALKNLKTGVPITITWTKNKIKRTWVGYVSLVSAELHVSARKHLEVRCIGASFPLKERSSRTYNNKTITQVAEALAKEHGLNYIGTNHSRIFPVLNIAGQSCWEWLTEQAKRIGYGLVIDGINLYFKPIDELIDASSSESPILSYMAPEFPTDTLYADRTLDFFKVLSGEYVEAGELRTSKQVGGVDPVTGKPVTAMRSAKTVGKASRKKSNDVFFSDQATSQVVHDATSATTAASGAAHISRFTTPAQVKAQGDPRMKPFSAVYVDGVSSELDGHWIIQQVKHVMSMSGDYQVEMTVTSDGSGANLASATRTTTGERVGVVDVHEALRNKGKTAKTLSNSSARLASKSHTISESNQGFNRTPTKWVTAPRKRKAVK
jgi:phage protein D